MPARGGVVFPNNLDTSRFPLRTRRWGIFIGALIMVSSAIALVTPGTLEVTMPICFVAILAAAAARGSLANLKPEIGSGAVVSLAFLGFAILSSIWAEHPHASFGWALSALLAFVGCGVAARALLAEPRRNIFHISEGLWIGFLAGLIYLAIEILSDQIVKITLYNALQLGPADLRPKQFFRWEDGRLASISASDLTRSVASIPILLWAVVMAVRGTTSAALVNGVTVLVLALATLVIALSENETAKTALALGVVAYIVTRIRPAAALRLLQAGWIAACLAIVPISLALYRLNVHNASWVQPTAQHRIIIWNRVSEETMKSPIKGIGAGMTYWNFDNSKVPKDGEVFTRYSRDAHNVFLQTWFELGVIGAMLLTLVGLAVLKRIERLGEAAAPYGYATFASAAATLASSWGMWRPWFVYIFAFAVVMFAIGLRASIRSQRTPGLPHALD